jgi:hypothetical protein
VLGLARGWLLPVVGRRFLVPVTLLVATSVRLHAQAQTVSGSDTATTRLSRSAFDDLPSSGTIGGLLETTIPEIISDRIEGGGLSVGSSSRLGARGTSWTQNAFQLGGLDFTDPGRFGGSLLFLDPSMLDGVEISTAMMPVEQSAPGVSVRMIPSRPSDKWGGRAEFFSTLSHPPAPTEPVPPISTLHTWNRMTAAASGPLFGNRAKAMVGVAATNATRFDRADPTLLHSRDVSGVAHILFAPSTTDEVSVVGAAQSARVPLDGRLWLGQPDATQRVSDLLMEVGWRRRARLVSLTAAGGFWDFAAKPEMVSSSLAYIDSTRDRPIMDAVSASQSHQRWSASFRVAGMPEHENRWLRGGRAGVEIGHATAADGALLAPAVAESVEGFPARLWRFKGATTGHGGTTFTAYAAEMVPLGSRVTMDAGVRTEVMTASADTGPAIQWIDLFPRLSLRWNVDSNQRVSGILGLGRYGHRLPLELLNYGDPAAASADVFRWTDRNGDKRFDSGEQGPLISRVGAGPSGTSVIDDRLQRPTLDELLLGVEVRPSPRWAVGFSALARQEHHLIAAVNDGAPLGAYTVTAVMDPGGDLLDPSDDQHLPIFNRRPETFGADHYVLTNPDGLKTTHHGIELNVRYSGDRLWIIAGATAGRMEGAAAARGFHVFQNDAAIPTDAFSNPNAATFTHGTAFSDRGYTIKTSGTYRFAHDVRLGIVARYQDGQAFSRIVLAQDLNQGAEAIRAYRAARTRFTYTLTADARVQVPLTVARQHFDLVWDVFNFVNRDNEVEEFVVTGPAFRTPTALQPRPTMHLGVRVAF